MSAALLNYPTFEDDKKEAVIIRAKDTADYVGKINLDDIEQSLHISFDRIADKHDFDEYIARSRIHSAL